MHVVNNWMINDVNLGIFHTYSFFLCLVHQKGIDRCNEGGWLALQSYVPGKKVLKIQILKLPIYITVNICIASCMGPQNQGF